MHCRRAGVLAGANHARRTVSLRQSQQTSKVRSANGIKELQPQRAAQSRGRQGLPELPGRRTGQATRGNPPVGGTYAKAA